MSNDKPTLGELYLQQRDRAEKADADIAVLRHELDVLKRETEARASREYDRGWNDGHGKKLDAMLERGCAERYLAERDKEREGASALRAKLDGCEKAHEATHQRLHGVLADYDKATGCLTVENERLTAQISASTPVANTFATQQLSAAEVQAALEAEGRRSAANTFATQGVLAMVFRHNGVPVSGVRPLIEVCAAMGRAFRSMLPSTKGCGPPLSKVLAKARPGTI